MIGYRDVILFGGRAERHSYATPWWQPVRACAAFDRVANRLERVQDTPRRSVRRGVRRQRRLCACLSGDSPRSCLEAHHSCGSGFGRIDWTMSAQIIDARSMLPTMAELADLVREMMFQQANFQAQLTRIYPSLCVSVAQLLVTVESITVVDSNLRLRPGRQQRGRAFADEPEDDVRGTIGYPDGVSNRWRACMPTHVSVVLGQWGGARVEGSAERSLGDAAIGAQAYGRRGLAAADGEEEAVMSASGGHVPVGAVPRESAGWVSFRCGERPAADE